MSYLHLSDLPFKNFIYSQYSTVPVLDLVIVKNKLTSVFYASVLLFKINFVITLSKFAVEPLTCHPWFHSHYENVMMQFLINNRTDAQKTDVNLLIIYNVIKGPPSPKMHCAP